MFDSSGGRADTAVTALTAVTRCDSCLRDEGIEWVPAWEGLGAHVDRGPGGLAYLLDLAAL